ncbi:MAG TPA: acyltransferase, partial [Fimbriimonas sp.]|nr:acyltransferase [Fimbriimonas sp.]
HFSERCTANPNFALRLLQKGGQLPLMTFFVLSGFVIGLRHVHRSESFGSYARSRFMRIYPVYLFSLFAAVAVVMLAQQTAVPANAPAFWRDQVLKIQSDGGIRTFLGNVFMLQGPKWFPNEGCFAPYGGTSPLWSLSFEWWFYMAFWLLKTKLKLPVARNLVYGWAIVSTVGLCFYPCQPFVWSAAFSVWWAGVELAIQYEKEKSLSLAKQLPTALTLGAQFVLLLVGGYVLHRWRHIDSHTVLNVYDWIFCALSVFIAALLFSKSFARPFPKTTKIVRRLGADSYAIYAVHYVLFNVVAILAHSHLIVWLSLATVGTYLLADFMEHHVHPAGVRLIKSFWKSA